MRRSIPLRDAADIRHGRCPEFRDANPGRSRTRKRRAESLTMVSVAERWEHLVGAVAVGLLGWVLGTIGVWLG